MILKYYSTNAIYEYLLNNNLNNFVFANENIWLVVYGNELSEPKLILVISALSTEQYEEKRFFKYELEIINMADKLSKLSGLDFKMVRYCKDEPELSDVQYIDYKSHRCKSIHINRLAELFEKYGINTQPAKTQKYLNDKTSSAYHKWQREVLGNHITVSDIDLVKVEDGKVLAIYELKRSIIPIENWKPFKDDYANFRLIEKFAYMVNSEFKIVYNRRIKEPFYDDISKLKLFSFDCENNESKYCDTVSLDDFIGGNYNG